MSQPHLSSPGKMSAADAAEWLRTVKMRPGQKVDAPALAEKAREEGWSSDLAIASTREALAIVQGFDELPEQQGGSPRRAKRSKPVLRSEISSDDTETSAQDEERLVADRRVRHLIAIPNFVDLLFPQQIGSITPAVPEDTYFVIGRPQVPVPSGSVEALYFKPVPWNGKYADATQKTAAAQQTKHTLQLAEDEWRFEQNALPLPLDGSLNKRAKDSKGQPYPPSRLEKDFFFRVIEAPPAGLRIDFTLGHQVQLMDASLRALLIPMPSERKMWKNLLSLPKALTRALEKAQKVADVAGMILLIEQYLSAKDKEDSTNFTYLVNQNMSALFKACPKDLPLIMSVLGTGACTQLSWFCAAVLRAYGVPAWITKERGVARGLEKNGQGLNKSFGHARVLYVDQNFVYHTFDPTSVCTINRSFLATKSGPIALLIQNLQKAETRQEKIAALQAFENKEKAIAKSSLLKQLLYLERFCPRPGKEIQKICRDMNDQQLLKALAKLGEIFRDRYVKGLPHTEEIFTRFPGMRIYRALLLEIAERALYVVSSDVPCGRVYNRLESSCLDNQLTPLTFFPNPHSSLVKPTWDTAALLFGQFDYGGWEVIKSDLRHIAQPTSLNTFFQRGFPTRVDFLDNDIDIIGLDPSICRRRLPPGRNGKLQILESIGVFQRLCLEEDLRARMLCSPAKRNMFENICRQLTEASVGCSKEPIRRDVALAAHQYANMKRTIAEALKKFHHGRHQGFEQDRNDKRQYAHGDSLRSIDWRAYARSDIFIVPVNSTRSQAQASALHVLFHPCGYVYGHAEFLKFEEVLRQLHRLPTRVFVGCTGDSTFFSLSEIFRITRNNSFDALRVLFGDFPALKLRLPALHAQRKNSFPETSRMKSSNLVVTTSFTTACAFHGLLGVPVLNLHSEALCVTPYPTLALRERDN